MLGVLEWCWWCGFDDPKVNVWCGPVPPRRNGFECSTERLPGRRSGVDTVSGVPVGGDSQDHGPVDCWHWPTLRGRCDEIFEVGERGELHRVFLLHVRSTFQVNEPPFTARSGGDGAEHVDRAAVPGLVVEAGCFGRFNIKLEVVTELDERRI